MADPFQLARTVLGPTHFEQFTRSINKKRKDFLLRNNTPTESQNPYQELSFTWQSRARRFAVYQGSKLWGYIDTNGNILYPARYPTLSQDLRGNIRDKHKGLQFINEDGTIMNKYLKSSC